MKLLARFNLLFLAIFAVGVALSAWVANRFLQQEAEDRVHTEAELMTETASAARLYTGQQVGPLLARLQKRESLLRQP